ncbi:MAG: YdcF family protein [Alphaproteobacteria bacterium]|nr:YdcF family protein [Alphaproteobacteria bacterium]
MNLKNSVLPPLFNGLFLFLLIWLAGLVIYSHDTMDLQKYGMNPNVKADGIVVLTGGTERVPAGLDLLQAGAAPRLLISGVDPRTGAESIIQNHPAKSKMECCITLGVFAEDTHGNAKEAAGWVKKYDLKSLIVVTSNYHMRRALLEFHQALPNIPIDYVAVNPPSAHIGEWWAYPGTASLMMEEYNKLLFAFVKAALHYIMA